MVSASPFGDTLVVLTVFGESFAYTAAFEQFHDFTYAMIHDMKSPLSSIRWELIFWIAANCPVSLERREIPAGDDGRVWASLTFPIVYWYLPSWMRTLELHQEEVLCGPLLDDMIAKISPENQQKGRISRPLYHRWPEMVHADASFAWSVGQSAGQATTFHEEAKIDIISRIGKAFCKIKVWQRIGYSLKDQSVPLSSTVLNVLQQSGRSGRAVAGLVRAWIMYSRWCYTWRAG